MFPIFHRASWICECIVLTQLENFLFFFKMFLHSLIPSRTLTTHTSDYLKVSFSSLKRCRSISSPSPPPPPSLCHHPSPPPPPPSLHHHHHLLHHHHQHHYIITITTSIITSSPSPPASLRHHHDHQHHYVITITTSIITSSPSPPASLRHHPITTPLHLLLRVFYCYVKFSNLFFFQWLYLLLM